MHQSILHLEAFTDAHREKAYRTIFKTQHGRLIYLAVNVTGENCTITDCFYTDRNQGRTGSERRKSRPAKLNTLQIPVRELLNVINTELDKKFYGVELIDSAARDLSVEEYIIYKSALSPAKYHFLIMEGAGDNINGLPSHIRTRLKNKFHRSIYLVLSYYKDGSGVVKQCFYYDRSYLRSDLKITPPSLISCFFPYTREGILNLVNNEICCNFTHIIFIDGTEGIDLDSNTTPICGSI